MSSSASDHEFVWRTPIYTWESNPALPDAFLSALITDLDSDAVTAMVLVGSHARESATPYSDVDVIRFVQEMPERLQEKVYSYRDGRLVSVVTRTLDLYRAWMAMPEQAIFIVPGLREARILLDKEGAFSELQQAADLFEWEPLQTAANEYASFLMMVYIEYVNKILRALFLHDMLALSEMISALFVAMTDAMMVQRGILVKSGNSYFQQAQESAGWTSVWTRYHRLLAGVDLRNPASLTLQAKGEAALHLYRETVNLLQPALHPLHRDVIEQTVSLIDLVLSSA